MMTGFLLPYDSLEEHKELTDEQYGRIIRATLRYAIDGTEPELPVPEKYLWPGLRQKVIRDQNQYAKKCAQNAENINKRWERQREQRQDQEPETEADENDTNVYDRIRTDTNDTNININIKSKSNINNKSNININQSNQIHEQLAAEGYKTDEINRALERCEGKKIRNLVGYIRQSIDNERRAGAGTAKKRVIPFQDFPQRSYAGVDKDMMDKLAEEVQEFNKQQQEGGGE